MERGPIYSVELIDSLPIGTGSMRQAMPSRDDLNQVVMVNLRAAAGYEVLLDHWRDQQEHIEHMEHLMHEALEWGLGRVHAHGWDAVRAAETERQMMAIIGIVPNPQASAAAKPSDA